jgi:hypothetical protein
MPTIRAPLRLGATQLATLALAAVIRPAAADESIRGCAPSFLVEVAERPQTPPAASLFLWLTSTAHYSCVGYRIPLRLEQAASAGRVRVLVGDVQAPRGPCPQALGPAKGELELPALPLGEHVLELVHRGRSDRYRLRVTATELSFSPLATCFSSGGDELPRRRVPLGAFSLACSEVQSGECANRAVRSLPSCAGFFAEPLVARLARLQPAAGGWATRAFAAGAPVFVDGDRAELERLIRERYAARDSCLSLVLRSVGGPGLSN